MRYVLLESSHHHVDLGEGVKLKSVDLRINFESLSYYLKSEG